MDSPALSPSGILSVNVEEHNEGTVKRGLFLHAIFIFTDKYKFKKKKTFLPNDPEITQYKSLQ